MKWIATTRGGRRAWWLPGFVLGLSCGCGGLATDSPGAIMVHPPRQVDAACGDQYVWLPHERTVRLVIPAKDCWSVWFALPRQAAGVEFRPAGVLDVQVAFEDGEVLAIDAARPFAPMPRGQRPAAVRYRNRQTQSVVVDIDFR